MSKDVVKRATKGIILNLLIGTDESQKIGEQKLRAIEVTDNYGLALLEIIFQEDNQIEHRQMAAILLKRYVNSHWSKNNRDCVSPVINDGTKRKLKASLPDALSVSDNVLRNTIAAILAAIGNFDFPLSWPNLIDEMFNNFKDFSERQCEGVVKLLTEFIKTATADQIFVLGPMLYEHLYHILVDYTKYTTKLRTEVIYVFSYIISVNSTHENAASMNLSAICHQFFELQRNQLVMPYSTQSDFLLKSVILRSYITVYQSNPLAMDNIICMSLNDIWQILNRCGQEYLDVLSLTKSTPRDYQEDSPASLTHFFKLVGNIFELIEIVWNGDGIAECIVENSTDLIYHIILFMAISPDVETLWKTDNEIWIIEEVGTNETLRSTCSSLLKNVTSRFNTRVVLPALSDAMERHIMLAESAKTVRSVYFWHGMECVMHALTSLSTYLVQLVKQNAAPMIVRHISSWIDIFDPCQSNLLISKIMYVGGKFTCVLPSTVGAKYLLKTIIYLSDPSFLLQYSAMRAMYCHCQAMKLNKGLQVYKDMAEMISQGIMNVLNNDSPLILDLGLNCLLTILQIHTHLLTVIQSVLVTLLIDICLKKGNILRGTVDKCLSIISLICKDEMAVSGIQNYVIPNLVTVFSSHNDANSVAFRLPRLRAIQILEVIVTHSSKLMSTNLWSITFTTAYQYAMIEEDEYMQSYACNCLRGCIKSYGQEIATFRDGEGRTGCDYVTDVIKRILDAVKAVITRSMGRFCVAAMMYTFEPISSAMDYIIKAMLSRLQRSTYGSVSEENLLMLFELLFSNHTGCTIIRLLAIPGPFGESALNFVVDRWLVTVLHNPSNFERNLRITALCRFLEYITVSKDQRLEEIVIRDELILEPQRNVTEHQYTMNMLSFKLFKVILYSLESAPTDFDDERSLPSDWEGSDDSDDDEEDDDEPPHLVDLEDYSSLHPISDVGGPLDVSEPLYNMNITEFLVRFLKDFSATNHYTEFLSMLHDRERSILRCAGIRLVE